MPLRMERVDLDRYLQNKKAWETGGDSAGAAFENSQLREKYNITGDNYSYNDLARARAYGNTQYTNAMDKSLAGLGNYTRYTDPYSTGDIRRKLENFNYNPEQDRNFQVYKDMYARQGQAAQGQTLSNLTAISGGRNNSWASAATAQVGQAYAQKTADMIPQLAQQAYNKLLQRYNIESQESDRAYGRWQDAYGRSRDMTDLYNTMHQQELQNRRQQSMDSVYYRDSDLQHDTSKWSFDLERQYAPAERAANLGLLQQAVQRGEIELEALPEQIKQALEQGYLNIEQVKQAIASGEIELKFLPDMLKAQLNLTNAQIGATNRSNTGGGGSGGGGSGGYSNTTMKELNKNAADTQLSNFLYSASNYSGDGLWSDAWEGKEINPAYAASTKLQDAQVVRDIKETLIANGYTSAQANAWIENAKKEAKKQVEYTETGYYE